MFQVLKKRAIKRVLNKDSVSLYGLILAANK